MQDYYIHIRLTTARLTSVLDNLRDDRNADSAWILVLENVSIAEIFAKKYAKYLSDQCDQQSIYDDFFHAALLDMHKAAERFDPSRGTKFSTFASHYAKGAVQKAYCDIIRQELQQDVRVVCQNEHFVTLSPFAPRSLFIGRPRQCPPALFTQKWRTFA